ncbi:MAG: Ni-sirohydrochlorin a,c-diamide reductive cyclase catalytic subunit [Methanobacteriaceae archaeon]
MHPRPSPIAASLYTLRDLNADVVILHGPHGCCFRTGRLLEGDGLRVLTTAMAENDFIFGADEKLQETLKKAEELFSPKLVGVVGTCASMIIGEDMKESINQANIDAVVIPVESHGGFGEGDNTEGAISTLQAAVEYDVIAEDEANRQIKMLKLATKLEKTRGMAQGDYIKPSFGDNKEKVAQIIVNAIKNKKKVAFIINSKKETSYLFADIINADFSKLTNSKINNNIVIIANFDENIGLPRVKQHAENIKNELSKNYGTKIDFITGGLDEYPVTGEVAEKILKNNFTNSENDIDGDVDFDLIVVAGVPHAFKIENFNCESIAVTDGPRLVEPLKSLGYTHVVAEVDAHSKTLGTEKIVDSDLGLMLRTVISWNDN